MEVLQVFVEGLIEKTMGLGIEMGVVIVVVSAILSAGIAMICGIGPAIGAGYAAGKAVEVSAKRVRPKCMPKGRNPIIAPFFLGSAAAQTTGIYGLLIALILIFVIALPLLGKLM